MTHIIEITRQGTQKSHKNKEILKDFLPASYSHLKITLKYRKRYKKLEKL